MQLYLYLLRYVNKNLVVYIRVMCYLVVCISRST